mmetsp:Transcript_111960/g.321700  ORF Transcript_111960/g.321700 Transcript_111960/m.321700 type:complete len:265 (+) Transcript_111960:809-1603(+)
MRVALAELFGGRLLLAAANLFMLRTFRAPLQALPRQHPAKEVQQHIADGLHIVTAAWFNSIMHVDAGVSHGSRHTLTLGARDVFAGVRVAPPLSQPEVHDEDAVLSLAHTHQKIVWLDVTVEQTARVNELDTLEHLLGQHQHRLEGEQTAARCKAVVQRGALQLHDHDVVRALPPRKVYHRQVLALANTLVVACFRQEPPSLLSLRPLELRSHLLPRLLVEAPVHHAVRPGPEQLLDAVEPSHCTRHRRGTTVARRLGVAIVVC